MNGPLDHKPLIGEEVTFQTPEGNVAGKVIALWEDQNIAVVESADEAFQSNYFVSYLS
jgi:hypothetical protein